MIRRRVDLPAPLGPTMARISELFAVKEMESRILRGWEVLVSLNGKNGKVVLG